MKDKVQIFSKMLLDLGMMQTVECLERRAHKLELPANIRPQLFSLLRVLDLMARLLTAVITLEGNRA